MKGLYDRIAHLEQLLVGLISVQLGILAYVGGVIFGKDSVPGPKQLQGFYWLVLAIMITCVSAYTQVFTMYTGAMACAISLENSGALGGCRPLRDVLFQMYSAKVPELAQVTVIPVRYLPFIALAPEIVAGAALLVLGRHSGVHWRISALAITLMIAIAGNFATPNELVLQQLLR